MIKVSIPLDGLLNIIRHVKVHHQQPDNGAAKWLAEQAVNSLQSYLPQIYLDDIEVEEIHNPKGCDKITYKAKAPQIMDCEGDGLSRESAISDLGRQLHKIGIPFNFCEDLQHLRVK